MGCRNLQEQVRKLHRLDFAPSLKFGEIIIGKPYRLVFEKKNQMRLQIDLVPLCIMQAEVTKFQKNILPADDKCIHANLLRGIVN